MEAIREQTSHLSPLFRAEMLLSFLKDNSLESKWVTANPELTALIRSGSLSAGNIATLFASCQSSPSFAKQMEEYLKKGFSE
jgi:hypothetical protein